MKSKKIVRAFYIVVAVLAVSSCKKVNKKSNLETVDNFSNTSTGSFTLNSCAPQSDRYMYSNSPKEHSNVVEKWLSESGNFVTTPSVRFEEVKEDLRQVLLSTPVYISQYFFGTGAKIYLDEDSPALCKEFQNTGSDEVGITKSFACWFNKGTGKEHGISLGAGRTQKEEIDVKKAIRHGMLRAMAFYYFATILQNNAEIDSESKELLESLRSNDPSAIGSQMIAALESDLGKPLPHNMAQEELKLKLFVETVDSVYCSAKTNSKLKKMFPKLLAAFTTGKVPN